MNMSYISDDAWRTFDRQFHDAAMFLMHASLEGELAYLRRCPDKNAWQRARLDELEQWDTAMQEIDRRAT